jgi:hypothetical protein
MRRAIIVLFCSALLVCGIVAHSQARKNAARSRLPANYLGFDRNDYPGDENLPILRKTFSFTSYWLNNPPGAKENTWAGKRRTLATKGFGFLLLYNGRTYAQLKLGDAEKLGKRDGQEAAKTAMREGFEKGRVIFLDQEEGGRLLPEQKSYLYAWIDEVSAAGYRAGVYCSGIPSQEPDGTVVTTAADIHSNAAGRQIVYWVTGDSCPPSPGCVFAAPAPAPSASGIDFADVWQYAQSPRRPQYTSACQQTYATDGECYPPGLREQRIHVDIDSARSPDPSRTRR